MQRSLRSLARSRDGALADIAPVVPLLSATAITAALLLVILYLLTRQVGPSRQTLDYSVLVAVNHGIANLPFGRILNEAYAEDFIETAMAASLVAAWFAPRIGKFDQVAVQRYTLLTFATFVVTYLLARVLQHLGHRPRPVLEVPLTPLANAGMWRTMTASWSHWGSFPSDHAAAFAIFTVVAFRLDRRLGIGFFAFAILGNAMRVANGYHWPSDVIGGTLLGMIVAAVVLTFEPILRSSLERARRQFMQHRAISYTLSFLVIDQYAHGFGNISGFLKGIDTHWRLFH